MKNLSRPFVAFVLVASLMLASVSVMAQTNDWSKVTALAGGSNLSVKLKNGSKKVLVYEAK